MSTSEFWCWNGDDIEGILPKRSYPPCFRMADRALLAGYPRNEIIWSSPLPLMPMVSAAMVLTMQYTRVLVQISTTCAILRLRYNRKCKYNAVFPKIDSTWQRFTTITVEVSAYTVRQGRPRVCLIITIDLGHRTDRTKPTTRWHVGSPVNLSITPKRP